MLASEIGHFAPNPERDNLVDLEEARIERRRGIMRRMYNLEELGAELVTVLSEATRARPDVQALLEKTDELNRQWAILAHELSSIPDEEWLQYRAHRER